MAKKKQIAQAAKKTQTNKPDPLAVVPTGANTAPIQSDEDDDDEDEGETEEDSPHPKTCNCPDCVIARGGEREDEDEDEDEDPGEIDEVAFVLKRSSSWASHTPRIAPVRMGQVYVATTQEEVDAIESCGYFDRL